ncbi:hypothetical protein FK529_08825 [Tsukamurella asaccharolytica]|uniref:Phage major capsid protein n=1 Tax=Tsukamurella asaccharolytica TaxID=2592067 RepID=A0A5C5RAP1_9ACTN|nr:hypothetical protein [Tsukamurella asaccharolytica]TWS20209.1 hypothetical protein FK529_08825 [Tsukamurella asaccharolytica]
MTAPTQPQALLPIEFDPPLLNPAPGGLYAATRFVSDSTTEVPRWLASGVLVRPRIGNYGGGESVGIWDAPWCDTTPTQRKEGERPGLLDPFTPATVWAYADACDMTEPERSVVEARALQNLRLIEPTLVEREFAARLLIDAGTPVAAPDLVRAIGHLEGLFAKTNTLGLIHLNPELLAELAHLNLVVRDGSGFAKSPAGHTYVLGGGYVAGLGRTLVATSQTFGWRDQPVTREALEPREGEYAVIAERSVVVGYEANLGAVTAA